MYAEITTMKITQPMSRKNIIQKRYSFADDRNRKEGSVGSNNSLKRKLSKDQNSDNEENEEDIPTNDLYRKRQQRRIK